MRPPVLWLIMLTSLIQTGSYIPGSHTTQPRIPALSDRAVAHIVTGRQLGPAVALRLKEKT